MSYPQPNADQYAIKGYQYFRLLTTVTSPGDIYESAQGGHAFSLGPDCDFANVAVAYFDDQIRSFMNQTTIGPRRSYVGRIDARNEAKYAPSARPGRIFFYPADLYDPSYQPEGFNIDQRLVFIKPVLEVIQYFSPQQSLVPTRNDKTYRYQGVPVPDALGVWIVVPYWGRKSATIRISNFTTDVIETRIRGVNYYINDGIAAVERDLLPTAQISVGDGRDIVITSNANTVLALPINVTNVGAFDALAVQVRVFVNDGPTPIEITVSDDP